MLVGVPPYFNTEKKKLFENIQSGPLKIPNNMSQGAKSLILLLLNRNPGKRLGSGPGDAEDIKKHAWFNDIDWSVIINRQAKVLPPRIRPVMSNPLSIRQFLEDEKEAKARFADFERTEKFKTSTKCQEDQ
jgi:serine/threonine protein kinase